MRLLISLVLLFSYIITSAQNSETLTEQSQPDKFYIGIGIGPSFFVGNNSNSKLNDGLHLSLLNFGYSIKKKFGINVVWAGGAHINKFVFDAGVQPLSNDFTISYGALMIGPMYSVRLGNYGIIDLKVRIGRFYVSQKWKSTYVASGPNNPIASVSFDTDALSIGHSFNVTYRLPFAKHFSAIASADYFAGKSPVIIDSDRLQVLSIIVGIAVEF